MLKIVEEFEETAEPATAFNETTERLEREAIETLIDKNRLRRDRDWSILNSQVVGAEISSEYPS